MKAKNIGDILKDAWQKSSLSQKEFADKMDMSVRNLQYLFEKNDIHISQLAKASAVLNKDFIKEYLDNLEIKSGVVYPTEYNADKLIVEEVLDKYLQEPSHVKNEVNIQILVKADFNTMAENFSSLLNDIKRDAELYGFRIG
ncbi:helix-turn-helix domain-containing protein [Sphingobacterium spiritivorum]|uniref:helix-turn-helix domain-containing protein n=1 Tax=Sphingobacterium spiritivorum TaxID=258 RepID=UPI003DA2831B